MYIRLHTGDPALTTISFTFSGLSPAIYRVRIVVTDDLGQTGVQRKRIVVPDFAIMKNICSVNLINSGVVVTGNDVTLSFREIGVTTGFMCRLDDEDREDCKSVKLCCAWSTCSTSLVYNMEQGCQGGCLTIVHGFQPETEKINFG